MPPHQRKLQHWCAKGMKTICNAKVSPVLNTWPVYLEYIRSCFVASIRAFANRRPCQPVEKARTVLKLDIPTRAINSRPCKLFMAPSRTTESAVKQCLHRVSVNSTLLRDQQAQEVARADVLRSLDLMFMN